MTIDLNTVQALAPDEAALKAAQKLLGAKKWTQKERAGKLIWGHCQGSESKPYDVVFDIENHGCECNCGSYKYPCKHILALAWIFTSCESDFAPAAPPNWVADWHSQRRPTERITLLKLAPSSAALKAAEKLGGQKWGRKERADNLIWGDYSEAGKNYLAVFNSENHLYQCNCPSRNSPCKHALALAWLYVNKESALTPATPPQWVLDWHSQQQQHQPNQEDNNVHSESEQTKEMTETKETENMKENQDDAPSAPIRQFPPITIMGVQALAPDQASLKAAKKLLDKKHWALKERGEKYIWGHCQGSGANPYLTVFDRENHGYKCSCPSRKFPCKHTLALAWIFATDESDFAPAAVPQWVLDWQTRRRPSSAAPKNNPPDDSPATGKDIHAALQDEPPAPVDPKKQAAAQKRAAKTKAATDAAISASLLEWQQWLRDQLRFGLADFLENDEQRCRQIAARLVDGKAGALASRMDELPAKWAGLALEWRLRYAISELGKIFLLIKMWQKNPAHPDVRRAIASAENRASVVENPNAPRQHGRWQVVGEQIESRRDQMISQATWLCCLDDNAPHRFALLLDFYPRSVGSREPTRLLGDIIAAEVVFYPSAAPLRGFIHEQTPTSAVQSAPVAGANINAADFFAHYQQQLTRVPWLLEMPFILPAGHIVSGDRHDWWQAQDGSWQLPIVLPERENKQSVDLRRASDLLETFILWDGVRATFGSATTAHWGRV